ncbi:MAG: pelota-like protein, partial [Acidilobaceae archaeon]
MKILEVSSKSRVAKVLIESEEDLWTLKTILKPGDLIEAKTTRDVAGVPGGEKERRAIIVKLRVERLEFQPFTGKLRVSGVIVEGPEEYGVKGRHHTLTLTPGMTIVLERGEGWSVKALEAMEKSGPKGRVIIAAVDHEELALGIL